LVTERDDRARQIIGAALLVLLFISILLMWTPGRWAASAFQTGVFVLAIVWAIRAKSLATSFPLYPLAGAVLWGLMQLALGRTIYRWDTVNAVLTWTTQLACFFLVLQVLDTERIRNRFLQAVFYFGFGLGVISTVQLFTSDGAVFWIFPSGYKELVLGPFVYHNQFAAFVELVFPLAVVAAMRQRARSLIYAGMAAALYASVIASASRAGSALVTLELIAILAIALARKQISKRTAGLVTICFAGFVVFFTAVVGWETLVNRLLVPDLFESRREMLWSTLDMIRERPLTGFGLGTWSRAYPAYAYTDDGLFANQAHNDWAQWAAEGGVPFFFVILSIAIWAIRPAVNSLWGIGIIAIFLHCIVDYPIQRPALGGLFFALLGALAAQANESVSLKKNLDFVNETYTNS
jgi:O-antigen ligase